MNNTWTQIVQSLDPDYDNLLRVVEEGPDIEIILEKSKTDQSCTVTLQEVWSVNWARSFDSERLDERLFWTSELLDKWSNIDRIEYNSWRFDNLRNAERFLILYNLKWSS